MSSPEGQTRPFSAVFGELNRGRTAIEASTALQGLVAAVTTTGRKGSLTLTITVSPTASGAVQLADAITVKEPKFDRAASLFYVDDEHNLVRNDPRQTSLSELYEVGSAPLAAPTQLIKEHQ